MAQFKRGGKQLLDYLYADLDMIDHHAPDNPAAVRRLTQVLRDRIREDIEPMLIRAEPTLEARIRALEEAVSDLRAGNVSRFKERSGAA
jgi:CRP-like cAMP-binding protein